MASITLEMLRMADKIPRYNCNQNDAHDGIVTPAVNTSFLSERAKHEDSIPTEVRRHLSAHLSANAAPPVSAPTLLKQINDNSYVNQRSKILWRTLLPGSPSDFTQPSTGLLNLPPELLCLMSEFLEPADMICLGLTCKQLFLAADYHVVDLKNLEFAGGELGRLLWDHQLFAALAKQRYAVKHRLNRDRLARLSHMDGEMWLTCSVCITLHPKRFFSLPQRTVPATKRRCLASSASFHICSHWKESYSTFVAHSERSACEPLYRDDHQTQTCTHEDHKAETPIGSWSAPSVLDLHRSYSIERKFAIGSFSAKDSISPSSVAAILASERNRNIQLCPHIRLGDEVVSQSFRPNDQSQPTDMSSYLYRERAFPICAPEFEPASCERCGKVWQFGIVNSSPCSETLRSRWRVELIVDEQMSVPGHPWTEEYLKNVEGGDKLIELMRDE